MSKNTGKENAAVAGSEESKGISRRGVVVAAAWAVPVISVGVASPAFAASAGGSLTLTITGSASRPFGSSLADLTATVRSAGSVAVPGEIVTFSVSPTSGAYFGTPGTFTLAVPTGPLGTAVATGLNSGTSTGAVVVSAAVVNLASQNQTFTIAAAVNAGSIAFSPNTYSASTATSTFGTVSGTVALTSGVRPATVALTYTGTGITGPATAAVDPSTGAFSATVNHGSSAVTGTVVATATGFGTATANLTVTAVTNSGTIAFNPATYSSTTATNTFGTVSGVVALTSGVRPTTVALTYTGTSITGPATAAVNASTGAFSVTVNHGTTAAATGSITAAASGFGTASAALSVVVPYSITGTCGILGVVGPGFIIKAGSDAALPTGTTISIVGRGIANVGVFSATGGLVTVLGTGTTRTITLTAPLAAGAELDLRTTLSISVAFELDATLAPASGYTGVAGKTTARVRSTLVLCDAN